MFCVRLFVASVLALALAAPAFAERRVALAIGESEYASVPTLPNPARDASAMAELFRKANFDDVRLATDYKIADLRKALRSFADAAASADVAVVYYAGHGVEIGGRNYLVPTDARLLTDIDVDDEAIDLNYVLARIEPAKRLKLVILDSCRENPFRMASKSRNIGRGLKAPDAAISDTLIAFAAQPGALAADGDAEHSPFTAALLRHLTTPAVELDKALRLVRDDVLQATGRRQEPWSNGSRSAEDVYLGPPPVANNDQLSKPQGLDDEIAYSMIAYSEDTGVFENFIERFPASSHVAQARARLEQLKRRNRAGLIESPQVSKKSAASFHYVTGLNPYGDNWLALRDSPNAGARLLIKLPPDTLLTVLSAGGQWLEVRLRDGQRGWVASRYVRCCKSSASVNESQQSPNPRAKSLHYVTGLNPMGDNWLALREGPSAEARMLLKLPPDTLFTVLEHRGEWLRVRLEDDLMGWVAGRYVACCRSFVGKK